MPRSLIPRNVPLSVAPAAYEFEACVDAAPLTQTRNYRITMTGPGRIKLRFFGIRGSGAGFFTLVAPHEVELHQGESTVITVTFDPARVRTYRARLKFLIHFNRPNGSILSIWGRTLLTGVGKACVVAGGGNGGGNGGNGGGNGGAVGGGGAGGVGDPEGDGQNGGGDSDDGDPDGGDSDDGGQPGDDESDDTEGEDGGGGPGTTPAAPIEPELTVCLRFWKLPGIPSDLDEADLDRWLEHTNRIWRSAGIKFERTSRPFDAVRRQGEGNDPHCLDVFIGGPRQLPGATEGRTSAMTNQGLEREMVRAGADADFAKKAGIVSEGGSIVLEAGGQDTTDASQGNLLAHELGHALGLGPAPDAQATNQEHLDPATGDPITNAGRLMHPESTGGEGLTDMERRMARIAQTYVRGGQPRYSGCERTSQHMYDPGEGDDKSRPEYAAMWDAEFRSLPDVIRAAITSTVPFEAHGARLGIDLDLDGDGEGVWTVEYELTEEGWRLEAPGPAVSDARALPRAAAIWQVDRAPETDALPEHPALGLWAEIPKSYIGVGERLIGWRLRARLATGEEHTVPAEGWGSLDLTRPTFVLDLGPRQRSIAVEPGSEIEVGGTCWTSSTFTGGARLTLRLEGVSGAVLGSVVLERPLADRWSLAASIPSDLAPGSHGAWIEARCGECGSATSLPLELIVEADRVEQRTSEEQS